MRLRKHLPDRGAAGWTGNTWENRGDIYFLFPHFEMLSHDFHWQDLGFGMRGTMQKSSLR